MTPQENNWVFDQTTESAKFLSRIPKKLLGPAGKELREVAKNWLKENQVSE